jgi:hypothetical protein
MFSEENLISSIMDIMQPACPLQKRWNKRGTILLQKNKTFSVPNNLGAMWTKTALELKD